MTTITNSQINITNRATVNVFYDLLREALQKAKDGDKEIALSTNAGTFVLDRSKAKDLLTLLQGWDKADNFEAKIDNDIEEQLLVHRFGSFVEKNNWENVDKYEEYGLTFPFKRFQPNAAWDQNHARFVALQRKGKLLYREGDKLPRIEEAKTWQASTLATLSGYTPAILDQSLGLCTSAYSCTLYFMMHTVNMNRAVSWTDNPTQGYFPITIEINLSFQTSIEDNRYVMFHEHGHRVARVRANWESWQEYEGGFYDWCKRQSTWKSAYDRFNRIWRRLDPSQRSSVGYAIGESADPFILAVTDLPAYHYAAKKIEREIDQILAEPLSVLKKVDLGENPNPFGLALGLALRRFEGESYGIKPEKIRRFDAKCRELFKDRPFESEVYDAIYPLYQASGVYAQDPIMMTYATQHVPRIP